MTYCELNAQHPFALRFQKNTHVCVGGIAAIPVTGFIWTTSYTVPFWHAWFHSQPHLHNAKHRQLQTLWRFATSYCCARVVSHVLWWVVVKSNTRTVFLSTKSLGNLNWEDLYYINMKQNNSFQGHLKLGAFNRYCTTGCFHDSKSQRSTSTWYPCQIGQKWLTTVNLHTRNAQKLCYPITGNIYHWLYLMNGKW